MRCRLRAGMAQAVIAEIGARGRIVGPVALGAVGGRVAAVDGGSLSLRLRDRAADDGAGGQTQSACRKGIAAVATVIAARLIAVTTRGVIAALHVAGTPAIAIAAILNIVRVQFALLQRGDKLAHRRSRRLGRGGSPKAKGSESSRRGNSQKHLTHKVTPQMSGGERSSGEGRSRSSFVPLSPLART